MQVNFEDLELLPKILNSLDLIEKHVQKLSEYIGYSKDSIYKLKDNEFIEGYHFHKKTEKLQNLIKHY